MSMLSSQADELRLMARLVRDYDYKEISRMLREAADTIISLRDRLQDAEDARYDVGFNNGVKACLQQLDGLIHEGVDVDEIKAWADRQWEEET